MAKRENAPATDPIMTQIQKNMVIGGKWEATGQNKNQREPYVGAARENYESEWERIFGRKDV